MNIIGKPVRHQRFGFGTVREINDARIKVDFDDMVKEFQYPLAFKQFLVLMDSDAQSIILEEIRNMEKREKKEEQVVKVTTCQVLKRRPAKINQLRRITKEPICENVAFKCTYCDGGKTSRRIGFTGVCSDTVMRFNVKKAKHVWCCDLECECRIHLDGHLAREEIMWPCYESRMLLDWRASAGAYQSGNRRGQPIVMNKVSENSLCILTTREPHTSEAERFIFGVFLADEAYKGDGQEAGYVAASSKNKLELTPGEAHQLLFWKYYANPNSPSKPIWGTGLYRYLEVEVAAQILRDVAQVKKNSADKAVADFLLERFCANNGVELSELPCPHGALFQ